MLYLMALNFSVGLLVGCGVGWKDKGMKKTWWCGHVLSPLSYDLF